MSAISGGWPQCRALLLGAFVVGTVAALPPACSRDPGGASAEGESAAIEPELTGKVGMDLTLPSGVQLDAVQWAIRGPNGASTSVQAGTVEVPNDEAIRFLVGSIPAGAGFDISVSGTSPDGSVACAGSASFDVAPRATTNVFVALACTTEGPESGLASVSASAYDCASVTSVTASPAGTTVGGSLAVSGQATGPNANGLTYSWSASSGSFDRPTAPQAQFTCAVAGPATLTLTASDGPVPDAGPCNVALATMAIQVQCDPISDAGATSDGGTNASPGATEEAGSTPDVSNGGSEGGGGAAGVLTAAGEVFTAQQGLAFNGPLASFTASDTAVHASAFDVSVFWGDETAATSGTVTGGAGAFQVSGTHTYTAPGPFTVTISITDTFSDATVTITSSTVVSPGEE
jgi:hypothetical protein